MPSFAKKQHPTLKRNTLNMTQSLCQDIELSGEYRRKQVRLLFKNFSHDFLELMGSDKEIEEREGFSFYGEEWLKFTVKYLHRILPHLQDSEDFHRSAAIQLFACHLTACFFRLVAERKLLVNGGQKKSVDLIFAENVDELICRTLGSNTILELIE